MHAKTKVPKSNSTVEINPTGSERIYRSALPAANNKLLKNKKQSQAFL